MSGLAYPYLAHQPGTGPVNCGNDCGPPLSADARHVETMACNQVRASAILSSVTSREARPTSMVSIQTSNHWPSSDARPPRGLAACLCKQR